MKGFPFFAQLDANDCGASCLRMVATYYGQTIALGRVRELAGTSREGTQINELQRAAEWLGFDAYTASLTFEELDELAVLPCILFWKSNHYVVLTPQDYDASDSDKKIQIADPEFGITKIDKKTFLSHWLVEKNKGYALLLSPGQNFERKNYQKDQPRNNRRLADYLTHQSRPLIKLLLTTLVLLPLYLCTPLLIESLIDHVTTPQGLGLVRLIIISQIMIAVGTFVLEIAKSSTQLQINSRVNIAITTDFVKKLFALPLRFFDTHLTSDVFLRISDLGRLETYLTMNLLNAIFSILLLIGWILILLHYGGAITVTFFACSVALVLWVILISSRKKDLEHQYIEEQTRKQDALLEMVSSLRDIKSRSYQLKLLRSWERVQEKLFYFRARESHREISEEFFLRVKNIVVTCVAAIQVVNGTMSIGAMIAVGYVTSQADGPIRQLLAFIKIRQKVKRGLERLNDVHNYELNPGSTGELLVAKQKVNELNGPIRFDDVSFHYGGIGKKLIFNNLSLSIPFGKTTVIVGGSGSGKTTILKLLLQYYKPTNGNILVETNQLDAVPEDLWRRRCGFVSQECHLFSDTIANNIALDPEGAEKEKLALAIRIADLQNWLVDLPLGINTLLRDNGSDISSSQRLRIIIARAAYHNPTYFFLDEVTSVFDSRSEQRIVKNLQSYFQGRTIVFVANRLSTVRAADQILVLDAGRIVEAGPHSELLAIRGKYLDLFKDQLEDNNISTT